MDRAKVGPLMVAGALCVISAVCPLAASQEAKKPFTVADEIGMTTFGYLYTSEEEALQSSPDGNYFATDTVHGRVDLNCVEGSLRFYRSQDIERYLRHPDESHPPSPIWVVDRCEKQGPVFSGWRWLGDSSGVAFLGPTIVGLHRLMLADLRKKTVEPLTSATEEVSRFDVRDRNHYIYAAADWTERRKKISAERQAPAVVGTGRTLPELLLPEDPRATNVDSTPKCLWAVVDGKRFEVKHNGASLAAVDAIALSPDGHSLITTLPVSEIPSTWETLYPSSYPSTSSYFRYRIRSGGSAHQYVRVDVETGSAEALTDAPTSNDAGWWSYGSPSWSSDSQAILLPGTFLKSKGNIPSKPCVAVVDLSSNTITCVEVFKGHTENGEAEEGYHTIWAASFAGGDKRRVKVIFMIPYYHTFQARDYQQNPDGTWHAIGQNGLEITVRQGTNEPPRLVAIDKQVSRVIWDPNPQLESIELGDVKVYQWKDKAGREWRGGLYMPAGYEPGRRYPLVIQTHGFNEGWFWTSGGFPTAFAARELAANGIMVLQVVADKRGVYCPFNTPEEGPCSVSYKEAAIKQLVFEGLVDPERIGIIGFSRSCLDVMEMLTKGSFRLKAASVTDGVMATYLQSMLSDDSFDSVIGASPFGEGLQQWLKRSPGFNLDKVNTPLMVVGLGPSSLLSMWEPYAGLHRLKKPVEAVMLNTDEHILTNPLIRMASQGGSVDWFRFWLQGYEDPDPKKKEQYERWRALQKMQEKNDKKAAEAKTATSGAPN